MVNKPSEQAQPYESLSKSQARIRAFEQEGVEHLVMENRFLRATFLPQIGAKMIELTNLDTGTQFLLKPSSSSYERAAYGASFDARHAYGFDECFPTIAPSSYRRDDGTDGTVRFHFPDHGELWTQAWPYRIEADGLTLHAQGIQVPYLFEKRVTLDANCLRFDYALVNRADHSFSFIWAAHPLFHVVEGARLLLPAGTEAVYLDWTSDGRIGASGDTLPWPYLVEGEDMDFTFVPARHLGLALKVYMPSLGEGLAGLYYPNSEEAVLLAFDTALTPHLGLWLCYGGWPEAPSLPHFTVALEPTCGWPDALGHALQRGACVTAEAHETKCWTLEISLWQGLPKGMEQLPGRKTAVTPLL